MAFNFEFIIHSNTTGTLSTEDRSLIRSRCMQGKNKREESRRSIREKKRKAAEASQKELRDLSLVPLERPLSNQSSFANFTNDLDADAYSMLNEAFAHTMTNHTLSALDLCVDFEYLDLSSFHWLFQDSAFIHSVLCARYALRDLKEGGVTNKVIQPSRETHRHFRGTLVSLAKKLDREDAHEDEVVIHVVMTLVVFAALFDDWDAVEKHIVGLHKIVVLRGGQDFLRSHPKLHFKLDRLDLAWSLSSGQAPFFLPPTVSWDSMLTSPASFPESMYDPSKSWDSRLAVAFRDFQYLVFAINECTRMRIRYQASQFQTIINSLQSRLIHLNGQLDSPADELIRISMLAFLTTTVKVPGRKMPFPWLASQLRKAYSTAATPGSLIREDKTLHLWVLLVAAITVSSVSEPWLLKAWSLCWQDWHGVKQQLLRVMWVEIMHDRPGEIVFKYLKASKKGHEIQ